MWNSIIDATKEIILSGSPSAVFVWIVTAINVLVIYLISVLFINERLKIKKFKLSMQAVETTIKTLCHLFWVHYKELTKDLKLGDSFNTSIEADNYKMLMREDMEQVRLKFIKRIKSKKLETKKNGELSAYIGLEIEADIEDSNLYFDEHYNNDSLIDREVILDHFEKTYSQVRKDGQALYSQIQHINNNNKLKKFFFWRLSL